MKCIPSQPYQTTNMSVCLYIANIFVFKPSTKGSFRFAELDVRFIYHIKEMHSVKKLSARLLFFAPKIQNEVGVFAFYVFFENNLT